MGRKDKAEPAPSGGKGDDYTFALPDFDERSFMTREIKGARLTIVAVVVALAAGVVARLVHLAADAGGVAWQLGLVPILGAIPLVPRVAVKFGAEVDPKDWKSMLGNGFLVFATALAVWILLLNEPFA